MAVDACDRRGVRSRSFGFETLRQRLERRRFEDRAERQRHDEIAPQPRDELRGKQRVAARFEEVCVLAHPRELQQFRPKGR